MTSKKLFTLEELKGEISQALKREGITPESIVSVTDKYLVLRKNNDRMPSNPYTYYADKGWISIRDLFGLSGSKHYPLEVLKSTIKQALEEKGITPESIISLMKEYLALRQKDTRIPAHPNIYYSGKGWKSMRDLFGLKSIHYYSLVDLKSSIQGTLKEEGINPEKISSLTNKYLALREKDIRMPSTPSKYYQKKGWKNMRDLFGLSNITYYSYKEIKSALKRALKQEGIDPVAITNLTDKYQALREKDTRIPSTPQVYYADKGWKGIHDLFCIPSHKYYSFKELKSTINHTLKKQVIDSESITSLTNKYRELREKDARIPSHPHTYYSDEGWKSSRDLFNLPDLNYYSLKELKSAIVQKLKEKNIKPESIINFEDEYLALRENDARIPSNPSEYYADKGWKSIRSLFGLPNIQYYSLEELKSAIKQALQLEGIEPEFISNLKDKYLALRQKDAHIPSTPSAYYAGKGWKSMRNLFGLSESKWHSYPEAQSQIQGFLKKNDIDLNNASLCDLFSLIAQDDRKMPDNPSSIYSECWLGFEYLFQRKTFYPFKEAYQIAQSKGYSKNKITRQDYERLRLEDSMFPPYPERAYFGQWRNIEHFFGASDGFYPDVIEAQNAAAKLAEQMRIKITSRTYHKIAQKDPRLPPSIDRYKPYKSEWRGWKTFAGTLKYDIDNAREMALQNEWLTQKEYEKNYHIDTKLPANPARYFGLRNYAEFIKFNYWNIEQVKTYCTENKITSIRQYSKEARKNVYLKVKYQKIEGFTKARDFLYKPQAFENIEELGFEQWAELARQFLSKHAKRGFAIKSSHIKLFLKHLISKNALPHQPSEFFIVGSYIEPLEPLIEPKSNGKYLESTVIEFLKFVMDDCCYDRDEDSGELISINPDIHFRHPYQYLNTELESKGRPTQTVKPPLDFVYIEAAQKYLIPDFVKDDNGNRRPCNTFSDLFNAHELFDSDWFEVDKETYKRAISDPSCAIKVDVLSTKTNSKATKRISYKIWSPVRAIAMYMLFSLPLRGIQICYLDSGEADDYKLIEQADGSLTWVPNDTKLAGQLRNRGFLHREVCDAIGMNISTNKTGKYEGGYTVPWIPLDVARWVIRLRDWQSKYNPLSTPTPWFDISTPVELHEKVLRKRGGQCFLFRDPRDSLKRKTNPPGSQPFLPNAAFSAFEKLLYLIQNDEMPLSRIRMGRNGRADSDYQSIYSPHTLRVSHISALLFEGNGLDPIIVQKLVGHANLVMTIYYGVINSEQMRDKLSSQYKEIAANKQKQYQTSLLSRNIEEAKGELIYLSNGAGQVTWQNSAIHFYDSGMCPVASGRCEQGGAPINPNTKTLIYSKAKSCFQCRFFVTGPAFLGGLLAKFNEANVARKRASRRIESLENKKKDIRLKKKQTEDQRQPTDNLKLQLEQISTALDAEQVKFYNISTDQAAIFSKVMKCIKKINSANCEKNDAQGVTLILNREENKMGVSLDESSDFRMLAEVCEDAQIYDSIDDSEAVVLREKFLDTMLTDNGFDAMFFQLDEKQSRFVGNQMQKLLLNRLKGWRSVEKLVYGNMRLSDLMTDNDGNLQTIKEELSLIINGAGVAICSKKTQ
ncbi:hypothetical protein HRJ45_15050 [Vibrio coralliilyticus]|uniref:VPA1269 family protein n=1 Tax=Vibrio coralliilyticus TaxID=190893 RepID=UPI001560CF87|nr:VPA1269 family protein [Vibrio coralliilyticus]NRF26352.1 hypothetical protein [Vibrio coralliilyticus]NRF80429.1 hypothetical protein [Vibrio coralliilyticus]